MVFTNAGQDRSDIAICATEGGVGRRNHDVVRGVGDVLAESGDGVRVESDATAREVIVVPRDVGLSARRHDICRSNLVVGPGQVAVARNNTVAARSSAGFATVKTGVMRPNGGVRRFRADIMRADANAVSADVLV
jgi:hypothetical protein